MPQASWMIERLDEHTRSHHADADADFDILFRDDTAASHYLVFLMRAYGFEAPLEAALAMTPNLDAVLDLRERRRTDAIAEDMLALGLRPSEVAAIPLCLGVPQFRAAAEALGWMYVVERATLAHSVVKRHLQTKMPRELDRASAYFDRCSGSIGTRWRQFGVVLDDVARHPGIADRIAQSAGEAFRTQRRWLQAHHHDRAHLKAV